MRVGGAAGPLEVRSGEYGVALACLDGESDDPELVVFVARWSDDAGGPALLANEGDSHGDMPVTLEEAVELAVATAEEYLDAPELPLTRDEVRAELGRLGIDVAPAVEKVLRAVEARRRSDAEETQS